MLKWGVSDEFGHYTFAVRSNRFASAVAHDGRAKTLSGRRRTGLSRVHERIAVVPFSRRSSIVTLGETTAQADPAETESGFRPTVMSSASLIKDLFGLIPTSFAADHDPESGVPFELRLRPGNRDR